ncbi:MAG TPA: hypothetical protein VHQ03_02820 [Candidatus Dormibacteraeota bacterium]|nr:hypothetical protein [Candidatus Dormibacteraeota bacterium]
MASRTSILVGLVLVVALTGLWLFPLAVFPNPGANDAIVLSDLEWPLLLLGLSGVIVALLAFRGLRGTVVKMALGVLLIGVAIDLVIGLFVFGNLSNDRFLPLLFLPPLIGAVGLVAMVVALTSRARAELFRGTAYGIAAAIIVGAWMLVRGARDWLLAPYGFDVLVLIIVVGAAVVILGPQAADTSRG